MLQAIHVAMVVVREFVELYRQHIVAMQAHHGGIQPVLVHHRNQRLDVGLVNAVLGLCG